MYIETAIHKHRVSSTTSNSSGKSVSLTSIQDVLQKCAPYARTAQSAFEMTVPYMNMAGQQYSVLSTFLTPYRVDLLIPAFAGIILCFFGGTYVTLIAVRSEDYYTDLLARVLHKFVIAALR